MLRSDPDDDMNLLGNIEFPSYNYDDIPEMPCFECSANEDRPMAPEADEYPLGCEVELRDRDFARVAQEESRWEPFLDEVFASPRRRVKVCRHQGDYTFVVCTELSGYEYVGFTLYRACLSEPKVKTTKYYANIAAREGDEDIVARAMRSNEQHDRNTRDSYSMEDMFDKHIDADSFPPPPWAGSKSAAAQQAVTAAGATASQQPAASSGAAGRAGRGYDDQRKSQLGFFDSNDSPCRPGAAPGKAPSTAAGPSGPTPDRQAADADAPDGLQHSPTDPAGRNTTAGQARRRSNFAAYMKKGTDEVNKKRYQRALEYYNAALKVAPEEEARALSSRSVAYLLLNKTDKALQDAKRVIELTPDSFLGYLRSANVLRGMKQFLDAHALYKEALRREPENATLRNLLLSNSVAMLYDARARRFPLVKITFDQANTRLLAVAHRPIRSGEKIMRETTPIMALCDSSYTQIFADGTHKSLLCHNCGKRFVEAEDMCPLIPGMRPELLRKLHPDPAPVRCSNECHARYCTDECRSKAWAFHHWVECGTRGRWRDAFIALHSYLDDYIVNNPPTANGSAQSPAASLQEETSALAVASCLRITARMFSRMLSCVWSLRDAVHMFDWLNISPVVEAQREDVADTVRDAYSLLCVNFLSEEKEKLTYKLFERCYQRAKSNCVTLRVSPWSRMAIRAESLLNFVDADAPPTASMSRLSKYSSESGPSGSLPGAGFSHLSTGSGLAAISLTEEQKRALQCVLAAPPEGPPGVSATLIALFEIYAATGPANTSAQRARTHRPTGAQTGRPFSDKDRAEATPVEMPPNVAVQNSIEPFACLHLVATKGIARSEPLVSAPPHFRIC